MATGKAISKLLPASREGNCGGAWIVRLDQLSHEEADDEMDAEVDLQRNGNADRIAGSVTISLNLRLNISEDCGQQCRQRHEFDLRQEGVTVPMVPTTWPASNSKGDYGNDDDDLNAGASD